MKTAKDSPYQKGIDLFDIGKRAKNPKDPLKQKIWKTISAKLNSRSTKSSNVQDGI